MLRIIALLVVLTAPARAAEPGKPAVSPRCMRSGRIVFQKAARTLTTQTTTTLYASGAWTFEHRADGKVVETHGGCLPAPRVADLRTKAAQLRFVETHPRACRGHGEFTITIEDRTAYAGTHCSELDFASEGAIVAVVLAITRP